MGADFSVGSLTFERPSAVRFVDNMADPTRGVSCGPVCCTSGSFVSRIFSIVVKEFGFPSGVLDRHPPKTPPFYAPLWLSTGMFHAYLTMPGT